MPFAQIERGLLDEDLWSLFQTTPFSTFSGTWMEANEDSGDIWANSEHQSTQARMNQQVQYSSHFPHVLTDSSQAE